VDLLGINTLRGDGRSKADQIKLQFDAEELLLMYSAFEKYYASIKRDIETEYGHKENYTFEDDIFLAGLLAQVAKILKDLDELGNGALKEYTLHP
jgi:hypothetical protein